MKLPVFSTRIKLIGFALCLLASGLLGYNLKAVMVRAEERDALAEQVKELNRLKLQRESDQRLIDQLTTRVMRSSAQIVTVKDTVYRDQLVEVEKPVYTECAVPQSGTELQNQARQKYNQLIEGTK